MSEVRAFVPRGTARHCKIGLLAAERLESETTLELALRFEGRIEGFDGRLYVNVNVMVNEARSTLLWPLVVSRSFERVQVCFRGWCKVRWVSDAEITMLYGKCGTIDLCMCMGMVL